jgi:hypothetical protein
MAVEGLTPCLAACSNNTFTNIAAEEYVEASLVADTAGFGTAAALSARIETRRYGR